MNNDEFSRMVGQIAHSFTHAPRLTKEFLEALYCRIKDIDGKHCGHITSRICDLEKFPENLGSAIIGVWRSLDPSAAAPAEDRDRFTTSCPICDPARWQGQIVAFKKTPTGAVEKFYFDCPRCKPSSQHKGTREQIASWGYIVPPTQWDVSKFYFRMFAANNKDLVRRVGPHMGELLSSPKRAALAAAETPDEQGIDTGSKAAA